MITRVLDEEKKLVPYREKDTGEGAADKPRDLRRIMLGILDYSTWGRCLSLSLGLSYTSVSVPISNSKAAWAFLSRLLLALADGE